MGPPSVKPQSILAIDVPGKYEGGYAWRLPNGQLEFGPILFNPKGRERNDYRTLWQILEDRNPDLVIIEHPFLHLIADRVGCVKAWAAIHDRPWYMIGPSKAKKVVLGYGRANKQAVYEWAAKEMPDRKLTQHCSDALMYLKAWEIITKE